MPAFFRFSSGDVSGFKCLVSLGIMYGIMSGLVYSVIHMKHVKPLEIDAPIDRFSEARAIEHVWKLSKEIDGRQEGRPGLKEAAIYIKGQLEMMSERAGSDIRIEIEETLVSGSFNMMFLGHSISLGYRNHTNIIMRARTVRGDRQEQVDREGYDPLLDVDSVLDRFSDTDESFDD
ncbi:hypothetical protein HHK36_025158 [Tetracentron sinense]|uniref:Uncharacterized protein n=1 Tax=Tetracentron sinense TaxID=13715 RepID=A0A835D5C9_TETSI|nr:hypothetical protein HHK36_025158 [Tetracentron sinense]